MVSRCWGVTIENEMAIVLRQGSSVLMPGPAPSLCSRYRKCYWKKRAGYTPALLSSESREWMACAMAMESSLSLMGMQGTALRNEACTQLLLGPLLGSIPVVVQVRQPSILELLTRT